MDNTKVHELFSKFPKVSLGFYPTPLHKLETLSQETGVNLYIKREDFSGVSLFGGNKIRKLEYILGAAKAAGPAGTARHKEPAALHGQNAAQRRSCGKGHSDS